MQAINPCVRDTQFCD